jgi:hypothetical protein
MTDSIYRLGEDAVFEAFDDGGLILDVNTITFTELNITARDILQATDGKHTLQEVANILAREYEIDYEIAVADVKALYEDLTNQGILVENTSQKKEEKS